MSISLYKIKKWYNMLMGQSISHVNQGVGTCYSKTEVAGYYNDLTEKVTKDDPNILVPKYHVDTGEKIFFSIGIFQYGLASYDLLLKTNENIYREKLIACAEWALENQNDNGSWETFTYKDPEHPYSAMAQAEAISMLIRAHIITGKDKYLMSVRKAKDYMLTPVSKGGTTVYKDENIFLYEYTQCPLILNGWIFSLWGLYDYCKYLNVREDWDVFEKALASLKQKLPSFDMKYWSKYDIEKSVCSPFYHKLHIAQLKAMYDLFGDEIYIQYAKKWENYSESFWKTKCAFLKKVMQKLFE